MPLTPLVWIPTQAATAKQGECERQSAMHQARLRDLLTEHAACADKLSAVMSTGTARTAGALCSLWGAFFHRAVFDVAQARQP